MKLPIRPVLRFALTSSIVGSLFACSTPRHASNSEDTDFGPERSPAAVAYKGPYGGLSKSANQATFAKYCTGTADSAAIPGVNYANPDVKAAAKNLSDVADISYYFYAGIEKAYGVKTAAGYVKPPASAPSGTSPRANAFLTILCGEFRDRAGMIESKIQWAKNLYLLPTAKQGPIDPKKNLWSQVSAHSYGPYLEFSRRLHGAKSQARAEKEIDFGTKEKGVDTAVDGTLMCETKYVFAEYIAQGKKFDDLEKFKAGLKKYEKNCTTEEKNTYYDFRGDSNYKPYSPEGNGMIWYATMIAGQCQSTTKAKAGGKLKDKDCVEYFRAPFLNRYNAARAALATWLLHAREYENLFGTEGEQTFMVPHNQGAKKAFGFRESQDGETKFSLLKEFTDNETAYWARADLGFNDIFKIGQSGGDLESAYARLKYAVNRHTDWYNSGFVDIYTGKVKTEAFSPFVASSYEMSESDNFTAPGTTVQSPSDGKKHWMFVFKVKKENWFTTDRLKKGEKVDFDRMWFDETSFGTNGLADSEKAWDRLGTALEGELDSILYLHNISTDGDVE